MKYEDLVNYRGKYGAERIVSALASYAPEEASDMIAEGEFEMLDDDGFADKMEGHSGWIVFIPSTSRAAVIWNGDPTWYDAYSLENAVEIAESPELMEEALN